MDNKPRTSDFASEAGISMGYASDILKGHRPMPRALAIHMFRKTGWMHESIIGLTGEQLGTLAEVDPWTPPRERQAA